MRYAFRVTEAGAGDLDYGGMELRPLAVTASQTSPPCERCSTLAVMSTGPAAKMFSIPKGGD